MRAAIRETARSIAEAVISRTPEKKPVCSKLARTGILLDPVRRLFVKHQSSAFGGHGLALFYCVGHCMGHPLFLTAARLIVR